MKFYRRSGYVHEVRFEDLAAFLDKLIDQCRKTDAQLEPVYRRIEKRLRAERQLEFYFGEAFDFWWYDGEGRLNPRDDPGPDEDEDPDPYREDYYVHDLGLPLGIDYDPGFDYDDQAWDDDIPF